ncbi:hypothetical protein [Candidatus Blastococcus massiliensis]|nr:hypothetical protein [Candidatus Blastococcus massiliensis]
MSTVHDRNRPNVPRPRPAYRCLRHHVWLAACDDCRTEHADLLTGRRAGR